MKRLEVKGRLRDGFIELDDFVCDDPTFHLRPELVALFLPKVQRHPEDAEPDAEPLIRGLRIKHAVIRSLDLDTEGFGKDNPSSLVMANAKGTVSYEADAVEWPFDGELTVAGQRFHLRVPFRVKPRG